MLTQIYINNLTIIDQLSLELSPGLSVITGETGAGKSIWVDAVALTLGARAQTQLIRQGESRGEITLCFDLTHIPAAQQWLGQHALEDTSNECIIRRIIEQNGRSRASINGRPVALNMLQSFSGLVLTIHGQHQQQTLLKDDGQQRQVDQYAQLNPLLQKTQDFCQQWQQCQQQITDLQQRLGNRQAELTLLQYQLDELDKFSPEADEWQTLSTQHQQLAHSEQSLQQINLALTALQTAEHNSAQIQLQQAQQQLKSLASTLPTAKPIIELLNQADIYMQEASTELCALQKQVEVNPEKLTQIEQRLTQMHDLARKHQVEPSQLIEVQLQLTEKINNLTHADEKIAHLTQQQQAILLQYQKVAKQLTKARQKAADTISQQVTQSMQQLGMQGGRFDINLTPRDSEIHPQGQEKCRFMVSTNPGQALQPLQKVVSGGELSRIHLALQVLIAQKAKTPTLIFDEVDVGIGGQTAAIVGNLLRQLGDNTQVICITHLPQVAAFGHQHYRVSKHSKKQQTFSQMTQLEKADRVEELARMLGGTEITEQTRAHAAELLHA